MLASYQKHQKYNFRVCLFFFLVSTSPWYPNDFDITKEIVLGGNMDISILFHEDLERWEQGLTPSYFNK